MARELDRFDAYCSTLKGAWSSKAREIYEEAVRRIKCAEKLTDIRALAAILARHEFSEAPRITERYGKHFEALIGIGNDHVAYLTLDDETLHALQQMIEGVRK